MLSTSCGGEGAEIWWSVTLGKRYQGKLEGLCYQVVSVITVRGYVETLAVLRDRPLRGEEGKLREDILL